MASPSWSSAVRWRLPLRPRWLAMVVVVTLANIISTCSARNPPVASALPSIFRGSGCRSPDEVDVVAKFDESGGYVRVMFSPLFSAVAQSSGRIVRLTCNGVIPLIVEPGKRLGIYQMRVAGVVDVPSEAATALVTTEYFFPGDRGPAMQHRFYPEHGLDHFALLRPGATVWSPCGGRVTFRVNTALTASGVDTQIGLADPEAVADGLEFDVVVNDCIPDPRPEL